MQASKVKKGKVSTEGTGKKPKTEWKPSNKKEKKAKAGKRHQLVVVVEKQQQIIACEQEVGFAQTFNTHVLSGENSGQSHTGYHSESTTDFNAFGACNITGAGNAQGIYTASCTKTGQQNAKASTFFPNGWDIDRIRTEVAYAYCHQIDIGTVPGAAGACSWCGNAQTPNIIIGGRGPKNGITTAFPAYNGSFI